MTTSLPAPAVAECTNLLRVYRAASGEVQALRGVDVSVRRGVLTAVVGPSGSGKSSLLRILAGLDEPTGGRVVVDGEDISRLNASERRRFRRARIGYLFQRPTDNLMAHLTVGENIRVTAAARRMGRVRPDRVLAPVGLAGRERQPAGQLSGGEQQRLGVALALLGEPALLVADEPTAELDHEAALDVIGLLADHQRQGGSALVASHDARLVEAATDVVAMVHGSVATVTREGDSVSVIDQQGRLLLPDEIVERFPEREVRIGVVGDEVRITRADLR